MSMDFRRWLCENGRRSKWGPWTKTCLNRLWRQWDVGYLLGWQDLVWDPGFWRLEVPKGGLCLGSPNKKRHALPKGIQVMEFGLQKELLNELNVNSSSDLCMVWTLHVKRWRHVCVGRLALSSAKSIEIPLNGGEYTETIKNHLTSVISVVRRHESSQVLECLMPTLKRCTLVLISANLLAH